MATKSLRTSKDVYNRIKWDLSESSDVRCFVIGYIDRFDGMKEMPFAEFEPGGDIPWHRVYYFRKDKDRIWDRKDKIDKVFGSGNPPQTGGQRQKRQKGSSQKKSSSKPVNLLDDWPPLDYVSKPFFHYSEQDLQWTKVTTNDIPQAPVRNLRILTYNVLFGLYEHEHNTFEDERHKLLIAELEQQNADVICLQEMTPYNLEFLLRQPFVRKNYEVTTMFEGGRDVNADFPTYGQVIMSRLPIIKAGRALLYGSQKFVQLALVAVGSDAHILIANVHFTSTKRETTPEEKVQGIKRRVGQLKSVLRLSKATGDTPLFIIGDYNYADQTAEGPECDQQLEIFGFRDIWKTLKPDDPGYTFIPDENNVAKITSTVTFFPRRLDRFILHDPKDRLTATDIKIIGKESSVTIDGVHLLPSDHYGLVSDYDLNLDRPPSLDILELTPAFTSTLCLVPSKDGPLYGLVQKLRSQYDPSFNRWPPHINILYGFVKDQDNNMERAYHAVMQCLQTCGVGELRFVFRRFGVFSKPGASYVFLFPEIENEESDEVDLKPLCFPRSENDDRFEMHDDGEWASHPLACIYQELRKVFPKLGEHPTLVPHLTVGKFKSGEEAKNFCLQWQKAWIPVVSSFSSFSLMSRSGDRPFSLRYSAKTSSAIPKTRFPPSVIEGVIDAFTAALEDTLDSFQVFVVGSTGLGLRAADSDIDLALCVAGDVDPVMAALQNLPAAVAGEFLIEPKCVNVLRSTEGCLVNLVRYIERFSGILFEVGVASVSNDIFEKLQQSPDSIAKNDLTSLDQSSLLVVSGILDTRLLRFRLSDDEYGLVFRRVAGIVKEWAKRRKLVGNNFALPTSLGWLILTLYAMDTASMDVLDWVTNDGDPNHVGHQLLVHFFRTFSDIGAYNQGKCYNITDVGDPTADGPAATILNIPCPTYPHHNQCRKILRSTAELIRKEALGALLSLERLPYELRESVSAADFSGPVDDNVISSFETTIEVQLRMDKPDLSDNYSEYPEPFLPRTDTAGMLPSQLLAESSRLESKLIKLFVGVEQLILDRGVHSLPVVRPVPEVSYEYPATVGWRIGISRLATVPTAMLDNLFKTWKRELDADQEFDLSIKIISV